MQLIAPVMALHAAAFLLGYVLCKVLGFNEKTARTVSIETGVFKPSGLGFGFRVQGEGILNPRPVCSNLTVPPQCTVLTAHMVGN